MPARLDVLRDGVIRLTPPAELNDPFEMSPTVSHAATQRALLGMVDGPWGNELARFLASQGALGAKRGATRLTAAQKREMARRLERHSPDWQAVFGTIVRRLQSRVGVLCLSETAGDLLMWAHYADQHRGLVYEFDTAHPAFHPPRDAGIFLTGLQPVVYRATRPRGALNKMMNAQRLLVTKGRPWGYEREWRLLRALDSCDRAVDAPAGRIALFAMPAAAITAVLLGARASPATVDQVRSLLASDPRYAHVRLWPLRLDPTRFGLMSDAP